MGSYVTWKFLGVHSGLISERVQVDKARHCDRESFSNDRTLFNDCFLNVVEVSYMCGWIDD